jgi:hypothetical protein
VNLNFTDAKIRIFDKTAATIPPGPSTPYIVFGKGDSLPGIDVSLGGVEFAALADTGNDSGLILPLSLAGKLPLEAPPVIIGAASSVSGTQPIYQARLRGVAHIGCLVVMNPEIQFTDSDSKPNVGFKLLRQLSITLDPAEERGWFRCTDDGLVH